jgi:hypothetical protein
MVFKESETVELKVIATVDIKKEVIAFANSGRLIAEKNGHGWQTR